MLGPAKQAGRRILKRPHNVIKRKQLCFEAKASFYLKMRSQWLSASCQWGSRHKGFLRRIQPFRDIARLNDTV
jgi:hypothetical protein